MAKDSLDLFTILSRLDRHDFSLYDEMCTTPARTKEFETMIGWLVPQWMTGGTTEDGHILMVRLFDEYANTVWGSLKNDPKLRAKLLAACALGRPMKHRFFRPKGIKKNDPLYDLFIEVNPMGKPDETELFFKGAGPEDILDLCKRMGYQKTELEKMKKYLNDRKSD